MSHKQKINITNLKKKSKKAKSMPFVVFRRDHLRFTSGIICGSGSFAVQFGDHFRSGDHLQSGIICGAVQFPCEELIHPAPCESEALDNLKRL